MTRPSETQTTVTTEGGDRRETTTRIPAYVELYRVRLVEEETKADFNISAKTTRLTISGENIEKFSARLASVFAQGEEVPIAEAPLTTPISGKEIVLDHVVEGLEADKKLIVRGRRPRLEVDERAFDLQFVIAAGAVLRALRPGDTFFLLEPPITG